MRSFGFVLLVAVVTAASVCGQQELHIIKTHFPTNGDKVKVTIEEKTEIKVTVSGAKDPKVETRIKKLEYEDDIERVTNDRLPMKLKRHYTKAVINTDGKDSALKIEGKTISIFNGFGDDFTYTIEEKKEKPKLDPDSLALLDGEFKKGNRERLIEVLHPTTKAVEVNKPWKLDSAKLVDVLNDKHDTDFKVDKPKGEGKLVKVGPKPDLTKKDAPKQTGVIEVTIDAQVVSTDKAAFKLKDGTLSFTYKGEGVLDGSTPQGKSDAVMKIKGASTVDGVDVELEVTVTEKRTMELLPKKDKK
jgi:hypothetical protein